MIGGGSHAERDDDEPEARPDWLDRLAYFMKPRAAGRIVLVHGGAGARLRELVLSLLGAEPALRVLSSARPIREAPAGAALVLVPVPEDFAWLNMVRPIFEERALRVVLWCDRATVAEMMLRAPDFMQWVSHVLVGPRGVPRFAVHGVRAELCARGRGIAWRGPQLDETFQAALPGRPLVRLSAIGPVLARAAAARAEARFAPGAWLAWTDVDADDRVNVAERALGFSLRRTRAILVEPVSAPAGFWPLHAQTMAFAEACRALEDAGAARAGRLAALAELEPEAVALTAQLLRAHVPEAAIEPELRHADDPGAAVARMALDRGLVRPDDVFAGRRFEAPLLRALAAARRDAPGRGRRLAAPWTSRAALRDSERPAALLDVRHAMLSDRDAAALQPRSAAIHEPRAVRQASVGKAAGAAAEARDVSRRAIELLLREGGRFHAEGRYAGMLRAAERARDAAKHIEDVGLEVRAARMEGEAFRLLGRHTEALAAYSWIVGVAEDPRHRAVFERGLAAFDAVSAFDAWAESALQIPAIQVEKVSEVLDAGERFVAALGKPGWRAGLLLVRAKVLGELGRVDEAIRFAEEGLGLALHDRRAPGGTVATHRWALADLLREAGRFDEAAALYQAVIDDAGSHPADRQAALAGLHACALATGQAEAARRHAEESVRIAESLDDAALADALPALIAACLAQGDLEGARAASNRTLRLADRLGTPLDRFRALYGAARVALAENEPERARAFLAHAQPHADALDRARGRTGRNDMLAVLRSELAQAQAAGAPPEGQDR